VLSLIWPPDSPWAPRWQIKRSAARVALQFAKAGKKDIVYELGCGNGEFVLTAAEEFGSRAVGIEIDPIRYIVSWVRARLSTAKSAITIIRKDFKKMNISDATILYMYLVPEAMKRITPQLSRDLRKGTQVISYRYKIPLDKNERKIQLKKKYDKEKIFIYSIS
jgi:predicted RNA methylase